MDFDRRAGAMPRNRNYNNRFAGNGHGGIGATNALAAGIFRSAPTRAQGRRPPRKTRWPTTATTATVPEAVQESEEVIPVNATSTWVLLSEVTVGR
jgi:hypothetical protein